MTPLHVPLARHQAFAVSAHAASSSFTASRNARQRHGLPIWQHGSARYTVRCVIVDDSPEFVDAARRVLEHDGITVVGVASTSAEALRCVQDFRPDVTLVDVDLGAENGFELAEQLYESGLSPPPVIIISTHNEQDFADLIAASPAVGFVAKLGLSARAIRDLVAGTSGQVEDGHQ
jgi:CheY-like chemotaxis protein